MRQTQGIINVVQEGRFRLTSDDGRSALFQLAPDAPIEPQDLEALVAQQQRVSIHYTEMKDRGAGLAHKVTEADGAASDDLPTYFRDQP